MRVRQAQAEAPRALATLGPEADNTEIHRVIGPMTEPPPHA